MQNLSNNYMDPKNLIITINRAEPSKAGEDYPAPEMWNRLTELFGINNGETVTCTFDDDLCGVGELGFVLYPVTEYEMEMLDLSACFPEYIFTVIAVYITGTSVDVDQFKANRIRPISSIYPFKTLVKTLRDIDEMDKNANSGELKWLTAEEYFR